MKWKIKTAQMLLAEMQLYSGDADGLLGPKTIKALAQVPGLNQSWGVERKIIACIQIGCHKVGIDAGIVDGRWGPTTMEAARRYRTQKRNAGGWRSWRPEDRNAVNPNKWPKAGTPEFDAFYGPVGDSNLVRIKFPYEMKIAWKPYSKVTSTKCHKNVADSALRVLNKVLAHYGEAKIKELKLDVYGGCYAKRQMRGGSKWSMHSWGIAFDFDPTNNQLNWGRDKAHFARPEYDKWWEFWEEEGWLSLGRERNFDWMHVQAATL